MSEFYSWEGGYWHLGAPVNIPLGSKGSGLTVRVREDMRRAVVFAGFRDSSKPGGFRVEGTVFFLSYDSVSYVVTCGHVAETLGDTGWVLRFNKTGADSQIAEVEALTWWFHPDPTVDLAVAILNVPFGELKLDHNYLAPDFLSKATDPVMDIGIGDTCYTVGLYRFLPGTARNVPIVHVGSIAMMAGEERIPVKRHDKVHKCECHLIEGQGVHGISGSPVFVRPSFLSATLTVQDGRHINARLARDTMPLLGVWQSSWFASPDDMVQHDLTEYEKQMGNKPGGISLGKGAVVPVAKLIEILELEPLRKIRAQAKAQEASEATSLSKSSLPATDENPNHLRDFKNLLTKAAKTPPQDD